MTAKEANIKVNSLKTEIQKEIWRLQMCDYLTENSYNTLYEMQKELKDLKIK
tara:strand:+ start:54 stop:209 length:156 start_codon:yes stop_codon:yes gene_type:complete